MPDKIFLSGATGFLGTFVVEELLVGTDAQVVVLVRAADKREAKSKLEALWWERKALVGALGTRILLATGDVTLPQLGMEDETFSELKTTVTHIIHAAADTGIHQAKEQLQRVNVEGTRAMLEFAQAANSDHGLQRFSHISTAYVAGLRKGFIEEDDLQGGGFGSIYEQSKFDAELLVRACGDDFPISVFRPAQIVGDSKTGEVATFNTVYYPLKLYLKNELKVLPLKSRQKMNIVPVDYVAKVVACGTRAAQAAGKTFHVTLPPDMQPTAGELIHEVREWAEKELGIALPRPLFIPCPFLGRWGSSRNLREQATPKKKSTFSNMLALAPYFYEDRVFDTCNTDALAGGCRPAWQEFLPALLAYSVRKGFLARSSRTVFEQMQVRQKSKRHPIRYFDVSSQGILERDTALVREDTRKAAAGLRALGIGHGDRVAIVGTNSVRYLIADAAIGLAGAVSVPLYYTAPFEEIEDLVRRSGAKAVFVGMQNILDRWNDAEAGLHLISLLSDAPPSDGKNQGAAPKQSRQGVFAWDTFLNLGEEDAPGAACPLQDHEGAAYGDVATIRYTSGTTGEPKGVMFTQYQLKWMGETLPALLDWKSRNATIRYLSFLPMSHVVEGILVAYAPYYILSDVEVYYLNDFGYLTEALPKVRPTIFFSVPRFYEKAWEQLISTGIGKYYLSLKAGAWKRLVGGLCRRGLLRKAGLDACKQLIVGSAPISLELLESYRGLGIEIYNAYGLTEAPLITLSRYGQNERGSVGALLPETHAKIDDGEILVRGPQLTIGYDGVFEPVTGGDGYFRTGDFGHLSPKGHLVLDGRKKEMIITSYGKNINPQKIETRLKAIPLVSEVLLIGESLPYCSALIWVDKGTGDLCAEEERGLDEAVSSVNESLSHPEQVKKWVFITEALSIQKGELTPNLKLRRERIQETHHALVAALYGDGGEHSCRVRGGE